MVLALLSIASEDAVDGAILLRSGTLGANLLGELLPAAMLGVRGSGVTLDPGLRGSQGGKCGSDDGGLIALIHKPEEKVPSPLAE